jgi:hypothetical protein
VTPHEKFQNLMMALQGLRGALEQYVAHLENHAKAMVESHAMAEAHMAAHAPTRDKLHEIGLANRDLWLAQQLAAKDKKDVG